MDLYDVVVIGAGPAGLSVAISTGLLGLDVLLVEQDEIGGDCTHHGCVPSKTLLKCAEVAHLAENSESYGIDASLDGVDFAQVRDRIHAVINGIAEEESPEELAEYGVDVEFGQASFVDKHTVDVDGEEIRARKFAICTGSTPSIPPIDGLDDTSYLTNQDIFDLDELPQSLGIVGAGPIGCEMAQGFSRLGSDVVLFEGASHVLNKEDADVAQVVMNRFRSEGITVHTETHVEEVRENEETTSIIYEDGRERVDEVLVATGQAANTDGLGLDEVGVETDEGVVTNKYLQTSHSHIFAVGDVVGPYQFTHVAEEMAKTVVWNMISPWRRAFDDSVVPWCTYTDPEVARVGLNEEQAGEEHSVYVLDGSEVDRFRTEGYDNGMIKLVVDGDDVAGVTAVLPRAGEVLQEFVLAMDNGVSVDTVADTVHTYPTMADANKWVAYEHVQEKLTPFVKTAAQWLFKLF